MVNDNFEHVDDETQKIISLYITSVGDVLISIVRTISLTAIVKGTVGAVQTWISKLEIITASTLFI